MKYQYLFLSLVCACFIGMLSAEEAPKKSPAEEKIVEKTHTLTIRGEPIHYKSIAGTILLKKEDDPKASFFYTAYLKEMEDSSKRPITFCFNGGPGSSSVWLHLGVFGPQKVVVKENGNMEPPYTLFDNPDSILDVTDLVFIDPISTGYSKAVGGEDCKNYHGVDQDIKSIAEFIRLFVTKYERWESPKFIAGESYGTTRAAGLASYLHDEYFMYINGVLLISSILDFQTMCDFGGESDLAYMVLLPTYAATAHYHKLLPPDLQKLDLETFLKEVKAFSLGMYALALLQGDLLSDSGRREVGKKLSAYTGLSQAYLHDANLRVNAFQFRKELLRSKKRVVGRFDSQITGIDSDLLSEAAKGDPSMELILGVFTAGFNQYVRSGLGWKQDEKYEILSNVHPWDWKAKNCYLNVAEDLRDAMTKNTQMKVFVANGYYDLATPFFATDYTFNHLNLDPSLRSNVTMKYYEGGHMMYIQHPLLIRLNNDIRNFIQRI